MTLKKRQKSEIVLLVNYMCLTQSELKLKVVYFICCPTVYHDNQDIVYMFGNSFIFLASRIVQ